MATQKQSTKAPKRANKTLERQAFDDHMAVRDQERAELRRLLRGTSEGRGIVAAALGYDVTELDAEAAMKAPGRAALMTLASELSVLREGLRERALRPSGKRSVDEFTSQLDSERVIASLEARARVGVRLDALLGEDGGES